MIAEADLICYPMGSFYSSIIANLLPEGVTEAISSNHCPKVYIPNTGTDPEQYGLSLTDCVGSLRDYLTRGAPPIQPTEDVLNFVVVDAQNAAYPGGVKTEEIRTLGVSIIDTPLVTTASAPYIDPEALISVLLSLV